MHILFFVFCIQYCTPCSTKGDDDVRKRDNFL